MSRSDAEKKRTERVAAIRNEQARKERTKRLATIAGIVALLVVIVTAGVWLTNGNDPVAGSKAPRAAVGDNSLVVGNNPDATIKVVVYEDFLCPFCRQFETASRDFLHVDAAEGKVLVDYRPFQLLDDPYSTRALNAWGVVLKTGTPAQALKFHDLLYDNQPYENAADKPDDAKLMALAKEAGVKQSVLDSFGSEDNAFYTAVQTAAQDAKVTGTPTVLVNGKELTGSSVDDMVTRLEKQIAGS